jgi:hypothetical protein
MKRLLLAILILFFLNGQAYGWGGWDTLKKLFSQENTWTGEQTFANIRSKFVTINKSACNVTLTVAECSDTLITNYGWNGTADQNFEFCEAGPGLKTKFLNLVTATKDIYFDPSDNTTQAVLDGTACGDDERVWTDNATIYESITCHTFTANGTNYDWACDSINGAWLDKGS